MDVFLKPKFYFKCGNFEPMTFRCVLRPTLFRNFFRLSALTYPGQIFKSKTSKFILSARGTRWTYFWNFISYLEASISIRAFSVKIFLYFSFYCLCTYISWLKTYFSVFLSKSRWILRYNFKKSDHAKAQNLSTRISDIRNPILHYFTPLSTTLTPTLWTSSLCGRLKKV
jgi:hypothetical protein